MELHLLDPHVIEPSAYEELAQVVGLGQREHSSCRPRIDRGDEPKTDDRLRDAGRPRALGRSAHDGEGEPPSGPEHAAALGQGGWWVGHQHAGPSAQDPVDTAVLQIDVFRIDHTELCIRDPQLLGPSLRNFDHPGREVCGDQPPAVPDQSRGCEPSFTRPGA